VLSSVSLLRLLIYTYSPLSAHVCLRRSVVFLPVLLRVLFSDASFEMQEIWFEISAHFLCSHLNIKAS
jgi:hypothetical protein